MSEKPRYEMCVKCDDYTGHAGKFDDSLFCDECGDGPFCDDCWPKHPCSLKDGAGE